jgi:hypothetical protein
MRWLRETIGGAWELLRLGALTRFRLTGAYWRWRNETAFGADPARRPPRRQRLRAILDYARWVHRMRRL